MKTIRKQAADLKFGDVVFSASRPDVVFVRFLASPPPPIPPSGLLATTSCDRFVELLEQDGSTKTAYFPASVEVVSNLTPAQQHADELLELVRDLANRVGTSYATDDSPVGRARALVDEIDPPQPPTLDEALRSLEESVSYALSGTFDKINRASPFPNAHEILDRARRSGVLK